MRNKFNNRNEWNGDALNRLLLIGIASFLLLIPNSIRAQDNSSTALRQAGWTITADAATSEILVSQDELGTLMGHLTLNLSDEQGLHSLRGWTIKAVNPTRLQIRTSNPTTSWQLDVEPNLLKISSTETNAVITADLPASSDRIPARLLDPQGAPVNWDGTPEVHEGYGGAITHNRSSLPSKNPETMYFALGQVASPIFHGLFDRKSDIAIRLPERSIMRRDPQNPDILKLVLSLQGNIVVRLTPDYYKKTLGLPFYVPFDDSVFKTAPIVWSSWTSYYQGVREEDIVRNTDWLATRLKPYGFEYVELDDGYDRDAKGQHYWFENWNTQRFPHGPKWLTDYIKSAGLRPGLWLVPNAYAGAVKDHPDWYVRDKTGKLILDYATPTLDSTNPEVLAFVQKLFRSLDDLGFEYYKFDGEHAFSLYAPVVDPAKLHDPNMDLLENYRHRLALIREVLGPNRFVEGCPAGTPLNGIGYFNSYFNGEDLYASWQGMYPLFSSINANAFFNHVAAYVMPGEGLELGLPMTAEEAIKKRDPEVMAVAKSREDPLMGFGVTDAEARTLVSFVALSGVAYPIASVMPELPESRVRFLQVTMPTLPILPSDLFSRGTEARWDTFRTIKLEDYIHNFPEILDLKVNFSAGEYDVVGLTNWHSTGANRAIDLTDKLGLAPNASFAVFDFWNQKLLGVFQHTLAVQIDPHDTRVLSIHPLQQHPQLVGISRHISGTYALHDLSWDPSKNTLRGISDSVPGDAYSLWIYVPSEFTVSGVSADSANQQLSVEKQSGGSGLKITFKGVPQPVHWAIRFVKN